MWQLPNKFQTVHFPKRQLPKNVQAAAQRPLTYDSHSACPPTITASGAIEDLTKP